MKRPRLKIILWIFTITTTLLIISTAGAYFSLEERMDKTLQEKRFLQPTEFFAEGPRFQPRGLIDAEATQKLFENQLYRSRQADQILLPGDFYRGDRNSCQERLKIDLPETVAGCFTFVHKDVQNDNVGAETTTLIYGVDGTILKTAKGPGMTDLPEARLEPIRFAQYLGNEPLMQESTPLGKIPVACLNAVMAIEDQHFLEHGGFSTTGILRAFVKNIIEGRKAQGGSTITQQLVKNYFLTSEKSFRRKIQEIAMSVLLEGKLTKDEILQTYLNEIYLGQNGAFRVHGYGSASRYYFGRSVEDLDLPQCALLAAIVNNPGRYNPWKNADAARTRRSLVLSKMKEQKLISEAEAQKAESAELPSKPGSAMATETAPYFIDAVRKQMKAAGLALEGTRIMTSLDLEAQQAAQESLQGHLALLEAKNKFIKAQRDKGHPLEGLVLAGDPATELIQVAVGGRSFRMTQFNRAIDSRRQVGSVMKPFVYLTALQSTKDGKKYTPLTLIKDEKVTIKSGGKIWSPENYEKKFEGDVPLYYALKESLNGATASLALQVGLDEIITTAQKAGVESHLEPLPSLALGAFELAPKEVLSTAMTFAKMGLRPQLSFIRRVENLDGHVLFEHNPSPVQALEANSTAVLVGVLEQVVQTGTGRGIPLTYGFHHPAAGKTGTTNDYHDTWFYGFTPHLAAVVWVGYDDNTPTKLTGAGGSLPVWAGFMKKIATRFPPDDFAWPGGTVRSEINRRDLEHLNAWRNGDPESIQLTFVRGTQP